MFPLCFVSCWMLVLPLFLCFCSCSQCFQFFVCFVLSLNYLHVDPRLSLFPSALASWQVSISNKTNKTEKNKKKLELYIILFKGLGSIVFFILLLSKDTLSKGLQSFKSTMLHKILSTTDVFNIDNNNNKCFLSFISAY